MPDHPLTLDSDILVQVPSTVNDFRETSEAKVKNGAEFVAVITARCVDTAWGPGLSLALLRMYLGRTITLRVDCEDAWICTKSVAGSPEH